jgi:asparagine synthase (glutamine-hydrolysing)
VLARRRPAFALVPHEKDLRLPHPSRVLVNAHSVVQRGLDWLFARGVRVGGLPRSRLYADYENYLRNELRPWAERLLFDERTLSRGFYDVGALRALWERHLSGRELHTIGKIAPIMAIEMALRYLVDGDSPERACALEGGEAP